MKCSGALGSCSVSTTLPGPLQLVNAPAVPSPLPDDAPHILLVLDQFPKTLGGGERILLRLAALLPQYGFRVSILTLSLDLESPVRNMPAPCPIYLLPLRRTWDFNALRGAFALREFLIDQRIGLVQTFFESSDLWVGSVAKTVPGVRLIWSRRDMGILRAAKHQIAYRLLAHMPDRVFAVSEQVRQHAVEVDRIPPERVQTIYNGVDLAPYPGQRPAKDTSDERFTILSVGNIRRVKGYDVLLEASVGVLSRYPEAVFLVAGEVLEPEHYAQLQRRVQDLGLAERFQFLGGVSGSALQEQLQAADLFVLPSRSEGFSNAILEAMSASLPVVATMVGGNAEAVNEGVTGWLVPPDDPDALARAIGSSIKERETARRLGEAGLEKALGCFSTESMMQRITATYCELLNKQTY